MLSFKGNVLVLLVVASCIAAVQLQRVGGLGEERLSDDEVREIIERVRESIKAKYPEPFTRIEPVSYKVQTVAGKNYFIKAIFHESDGDKIVAHLRIYKSFRGPAELASIKLNRKHSDPIEYFE